MFLFERSDEGGFWAEEISLPRTWIAVRWEFCVLRLMSAEERFAGVAVLCFFALSTTAGSRIFSMVVSLTKDFVLRCRKLVFGLLKKREVDFGF